MTESVREMLSCPAESELKEEHPTEDPAGDVRRLSELYNQLANLKRERRDANAVYRKRAKDNNILVVTASIITFVILMALMVEPGHFRLLGIAACTIFLVTYAWAIWDPISSPEDPLTKQYFHSLDMEIWETERKIKEIEHKYQTEGPI